MALTPNTKIIWEHGTAYDFLTSLHVLHFPDEFELRGAWAAGVRSRLPAEARDFLEGVVSNHNSPLDWIHSVPEPRDAATVLVSLKRLPAEDRLAALRLSPLDTAECHELLANVRQAGRWQQADLDALVRLWRNAGPGSRVVPGPVSEARARKVLDLHADRHSFGERFLPALESYFQVFFSEEEKRIAPLLEQALAKAQKTAAAEGIAYLQAVVEQSGLAAGLAGEAATEAAAAPSYWCGPVTAFNPAAGRMIILFPARSKEESLVPGEIVPEELLSRLKAMTDPTRLRILRYLLQEQLTPAELARRLRLRAPTVTHHLHALKASGMVQFVRKGKNEHLYFARMDSIKETYVLLKDFLEQDVKVVENLGFFDSELL
jgi:DNA-binding transcriptional ArsR family regulator